MAVPVADSDQGLLDADFDAGVERLMREWEIGGVAVAVLRTPAGGASPPGRGRGRGQDTGATTGTKTRTGVSAAHGEVRCYGQARPGVDVTPQTLFPIFSLTKLFVALVLLPLLETHGLSLDTRIQEILPQFDMAEPAAAARATVGDLLAHTTGLSYANWYINSRCNTLEGLLETIKEIPVETPGINIYSNISHDLAARLAEHLSGIPFPQLVHERILRPLGMRRTAFGGMAGTPQDPGELAMGHQAVCTSEGVIKGETTVEGWGEVGWPKLGERVVEGSAGLHSCAEDMLIWLRHLETNPHYHTANMPRAHCEGNFVGPCLLHQSTPEGSKLYPTYGLGMFQDRLLLDDSPFEMHWGNQAGYHVYLARLPNHGVSVVTLSNASEARELSPWVLMWLVHKQRGDVESMLEVERKLKQERADRHNGMCKHKTPFPGRLPTSSERLIGSFAGPGDSTWTFDETSHVQELPAQVNLPYLPWLRGSVRPLVTMDAEGRYRGCLRYKCTMTGREAVGGWWLAQGERGGDGHGEVVGLRMIKPEPYFLRRCG